MSLKDILINSVRQSTSMMNFISILCCVLTFNLLIDNVYTRLRAGTSTGKRILVFIGLMLISLIVWVLARMIIWTITNLQ